MKRKNLILFLFLGFFLASCTVVELAFYQNDSEEPTPVTSPIVVPAFTQTPAEEEPVQSLTLEETANQVILALAQRDLEALAEFVHPDMGVRFSPYATIQEGHQVFMVESLPGLLASDTEYLWGNYDGTGDPIELTFEDYFDKFVYSADFANAEETAVNERIGFGNTLNNIDEFYPGSSFVEYHFSGFDEVYGGMDWRSLRLVFIEEDGSWFLVAVVQDQWTI